MTAGRVLVSLRISAVPPPARARGGPGASEARAEALRRARLSDARAAIDRVAKRHGLAIERSIPEVGAIVVASKGAGAGALIRRLEADPLVADARPEPRMTLRYAPDDLAFTSADPNAPGGDFGNWPLRRYGAARAWSLSRGRGAVVAVIDTGAYIGHPDLSGRVARTLDCAADPCVPGGDVSDVVGHGTHVAGLACGDTDNGLGIASLGFHCDLDVIRSDLTYGSIVDSIVAAANRGADAISMSFGGGFDPALVEALEYAWSAGSVPVAAGANTPDPAPYDNYPAEWVQSRGSGPRIGEGRGLVVTMAKHDGSRNAVGQRDTGVSVAAFGSATDALSGGEQGILSTWPPPPVNGDAMQVRTILGGDSRYAYLVGTSTATPQVSGLVALIRAVRPGMPAARVARLIKLSAGGRGDYGRGLGWGIIDAHAAVATALGRDITPPGSRVRSARVAPGSRVPRSRRLPITLRLKRFDRHRPGMPTSGVRAVTVWISADGGAFHRLLRTRRRRARFLGRAGRRYRFYTRAVDRAGNRERAPATPDASLKLG
jgi:subtilisin family serine protease